MRVNEVPIEGKVLQQRKDEAPLITTTSPTLPPMVTSTSPTAITDNRPFTVSDKILFFGKETLCFKAEKVRDNLTLSTATACTLTCSSDSGGGSSSSLSSLSGSSTNLNAAFGEECARDILHFLSVGFIKDENDIPNYKWPCKNPISVEDIEAICRYATKYFSSEEPFLKLYGTTYVFGDIHGNYNDLVRFSDIFGMPLSLKLLEGNFLFLGDYVDRGKNGIETVLYLFAFKVLYPKRIFLLRGNHEAAQVNGALSIYGDTAFKNQCTTAYGTEDGERAWKAINSAFDMLPYCAAIDDKIFCVHGGIPTAVYNDKHLDVMGALSSLPRPWTSDNDHLEEFLKDKRNAFLFELLWNDPMPTGSPQGVPIASSQRGFGAYSFGKEVIDLFYKKTGFTHIIRAHESKRSGVDLQAKGTLFTVFSSSGYSGSNKAATVLIHNRKINIIGLDVAATEQSNYTCFEWEEEYDDYEEEEEEEEEEEKEENMGMDEDDDDDEANQ